MTKMRVRTCQNTKSRSALDSTHSPLGTRMKTRRAEERWKAHMGARHARLLSVSPIAHLGYSAPDRFTLVTDDGKKSHAHYTCQVYIIARARTPTTCLHNTHAQLTQFTHFAQLRQAQFTHIVAQLIHSQFTCTHAHLTCVLLILLKVLLILLSVKCK